MEVCYEHDIAYIGDRCPMCEMDEDYKITIAEPNDTIARLDEQIAELNKQIDYSLAELNDLQAEISGLVDGSV